MAVKILFDDGEIRNYITDDSYDEIIYNAIKYHNKYSYPEDLDDKNKMFCKMIKDVDKLGILYLISCDENRIKEDDSDMSDKLVMDFYNNKLLDRDNVKNLNDNILLSLAMVFDINYIYSYEYIYKNRLIAEFYDKLKNKDRFKEYFYYVDNYVKSKLFLG